MATYEEKQQMYLGYFASIMLALLLATWFASVLAEDIAQGFGLSANIAEGRLTAAFFFMICFANPSALVVHAHRTIRLIPAAGFGFAFGWLLQMFAIETYVGEGLARFFMIVIAACGLPIMYIRDLFENVRQTQSGRLWSIWFRWSRAINKTHERIIFLLLMVIGFLLFVSFTDTINETLIGLAGIVALMTGIAAWRSAQDGLAQEGADLMWQDPELADDHDAGDWQVHEANLARYELRRLFGTVLPGAVFFGGLTWAASQAIPVVFPNLAEFPANPVGNVVAALEIGAVGLGFVMLGVFASVGAGLGLLQIIGHYARWAPERLTASRRSLLRRFSLRPMKRS